MDHRQEKRASIVHGLSSIVVDSPRSIPLVTDGQVLPQRGVERTVGRQQKVVESGAAAAIAQKTRPGLGDYLFFGHRSAEGGHSIVLEILAAQPILDLGMRLGEGTGAALAMKTIESALAMFHQMATFASAGVSGKLES